MNIRKMAETDAFNWARAEMFFGQGAGIRRRLLWNEIDSKMARIPNYEPLFQKAYGKQNMAEHALKAAKERKAIDRKVAIGKNARALARGDRRNMSPLLLGAIAGAVVLHQTGYDKVLWEQGKICYDDLKAAVRRQRAKLRQVKAEKTYADA